MAYAETSRSRPHQDGQHESTIQTVGVATGEDDTGIPALGDYIDATLAPATAEQIAELKRLAIAAYDSQEKAGAALKVALAKRGKGKLAELNQIQAAELIAKLANRYRCQLPDELVASVKGNGE